MQVEVLPIADFTADPENARVHDERNLKAIARSLEAFGQQKPIVVDRDGIIVAGNGTVAAASSLGWTEIAVVRTGLDKDEARAYAIADNRTAELATWDAERLALTMGELDVDLAGAVGFSEEELGAMLEPFGLEDEEQEEVQEEPTPEPPADPITKPGDLWLLGEHRLLCGDSTDSENLARLLGDNRPSLLVTDPPYGVSYEGGLNKVKRERLQGDDDPGLYGAAISVVAKFLDRNAAAYLWHASVYADSALVALREAGFEPRACIIWNKLNAGYGAFMAHYMSKHEPCIYAVRGNAGWRGPTNEKTVWDIEQPRRNKFHPTQKPVECMARAVANHKSRDVVDPFLGSGTTLIAAEQLGRKCYGMEISPAYCDVIVQRWENLTGQKAQMAEGGRDA